MTGVQTCALPILELNNQISEDAKNLTNALKGDSKIQGDWGEMILESILEKSGLQKDREYFVQYTIKDSFGRTIKNETGKAMRPDIIIKYPDKRNVIIDSKVSLKAFVKYSESNESQDKKQYIQEHLRSVKNHIDELSAKNYQQYVESLDFVMMFIPNEAAYLMTIQSNSDIWQYAYEKRVLLISPTNLITALKLISDLWKRELQNKNALMIAERGGLLYDKLVGFIETINDIGDKLKSINRSYESALNQLKDGKGNIISQVEKLKDLGVKAKKQLPISND